MVKAVQIKNFPGYYITDTGDVYSRKKGRFRKLKPTIKLGYPTVGICDSSGVKYKLVHRLIAEAFIPNPDNKPQINHKNGIRNDNSISNLEWVSAKENINHSFLFLGHKPTWLGKSGKDHNRYKLVQQLKDGNMIAEFYGCAEAHRKTGVDFRHISACCRGLRKTAGKYQWKYKNEI